MARERPPVTRHGITRPFHIPYEDEDTKEKHVLKFFVTLNAYPDGRLCEMFIRGDKLGGVLGGVLDTIAMIVSLALQSGVKSYDIAAMLRYHQFGPSYKLRKDLEESNGFHSCTSMFDLVAQWIDQEFPEGRWAKMQPQKES